MHDRITSRMQYEEVMCRIDFILDNHLRDTDEFHNSEMGKELENLTSLVELYEEVHVQIGDEKKWRYIANNDFPADNTYVLIHLTKDNWRDSDDPDGVYYKVAKFVRGLSQEGRSKLLDTDERKRTYVFGDEHDNNSVPYAWQDFGPGNYFGQEVDKWMYILRE